jgi:hypothetical protein
MPLPFEAALAQLAIVASRHHELEAKLTDASSWRLEDDLSPLVGERAELASRAAAYERYQAVFAELAKLEAMGDEPGLRELAEAERGALERERAAFEALAPWLLCKRAHLIVSVDDADNVGAVVSWFDRWAGQLDRVSENRGCGCCVDIVDLIGPPSVIDTVPPQLLGDIVWNTSLPPEASRRPYRPSGARRRQPKGRPPGGA